MEPGTQCFQRGRIDHVVVMLVGEQHVIDTDAALGDPVGDALWCVDEQIAIGSFDEVTIRLHHAASVERNFHDSGKLRGRSAPGKEKPYLRNGTISIDSDILTHCRLSFGGLRDSFTPPL